MLHSRQLPLQQSDQIDSDGAERYYADVDAGSGLHCSALHITMSTRNSGKRVSRLLSQIPVSAACFPINRVSSRMNEAARLYA